MNPIRSLACLLLLAVFASNAQELHPEMQLDHYRLSLAWLQSNRAPIELRGADATRRLAIPVPPRYALEDARLELTYTRSMALNRRSQLAVGVNGRIYAQIPLSGEGTEHLARIRLPVQALRPGYPELDLRAAQHYTDACEDPDAPELYTHIDAEDSALLIKARRRPLPASLARLDEVFDRRLWLPYYPLELHLPPGKAAAALLPAAAEAVQAVAARLDYLPMRVQVRHLPAAPPEPPGGERFPGMKLREGGWDAILLGTREMLAPHLHPSVLAQIRSAYLGLFPSDEDPSRYILVVSGRSPQEVKQAAASLNLDARLPDTAAVALGRMDVPPLQGGAPQAPKEQRFDQLGQPTVSFHGSPHASLGVQFWALRDWLDPAAPYIELTLNYAYGAGLDPRSALNVLLNGQFVQALRLGDPAGAQVMGARVRLPAMALRDGANELRLEAGLHGTDPGGECTARFTDHMRLTVFGDSRLHLPPLEGRVRFPDLTMLAHAALPYADVTQSHIVMLTDASAHTLSAALSWVGKLRQVARGPLHGLDLRLSPQAPAVAAATWIGPMGSLPEEVRRQAPQFMPSASWQQLVIGSTEAIDIEKGVWAWLRQPFKPLLDEARVQRPAHAVIRLGHASLPGGALIQFLDADERPVTVLTADSPDRLQAGVERLVDHAIWNGLQGAAIAWNARGEPYAWSPPTETLLLGEMPARLRWSHTLSDRPWLMLVIVLALIGLLAGIGGTWLRRRAVRRLRQG
jgi:hypothetical protein